MVKNSQNFPPEALADMQNLVFSIQTQLPGAIVTFDGQNASFTISRAYEVGDEISIPLRDLEFSMRDDSPTLWLYTLDFFVRNSSADFVRSGLPDSIVIAKLELEFAANQLEAKATAEFGTKMISWKFPDPSVIDDISLAYNKKFSTLGKEKLFVDLKFGWAYAFQSTENPTVVKK